MEIKLTKSTDLFESMSAPTCDLTYICDNVLFPRCLHLGVTYYKLLNNKLTAFRVLAYAVYSRLTTYEKVGLSFLVQMPNEKPQWIEDFLDKNTPVFISKEKFLKHQVTGSSNVDLDWYIGRGVFPELARAAVIGFYGRCWSWNNDTNAPKNDFYPRFNHFVVTKHISGNTLFVHINKKTCGVWNEVHLTKEECVKSKIDGIEIVEFADEPVEVNITILPSTKVVHTLRFIEE